MTQAKSTKDETGRMRHYLDIDKTESGEESHPKVQKLTTRPAKRSDSARLKAYTRIERGQEV